MKARKIELREVGAETCQYRVSFRGTFRQLVSSKRFVERVDREARAIRPAVDAQDGPTRVSNRRFFRRWLFNGRRKRSVKHGKTIPATALFSSSNKSRRVCDNRVASRRVASVPSGYALAIHTYAYTYSVYYIGSAGVSRIRPEAVGCAIMHRDMHIPRFSASPITWVASLIFAPATRHVSRTLSRAQLELCPRRPCPFARSRAYRVAQPSRR